MQPLSQDRTHHLGSKLRACMIHTGIGNGFPDSALLLESKTGAHVQKAPAVPRLLPIMMHSQFRHSL